VIAYITTFYPAVSHTFILREVEALRRRGVAISTTGVRRASAADLLSEQDRRAFETTHALLPPRWGSVVGAQIFALLRHPCAFVSTLGLALKLARAGWRGPLWQVFYFGEAIMAWRHWRRMDVRHVHAHFAAVPADVALLASHFGRAAGSGPRSWSFTMHGPIELWDVSWFGLADKVRHADAVVCISDFARSQLMALVEERHWSKLRVIHCGVDPARYAGVADPPSGRPRILCVGRLVPEKGQAVLLNALALLTKHGVDAELELVGEGPSREALEGLVTKLALGDRVSFAGTIGQDAIDAHYEAASVFCLPSFSEGVPVVLMEAMACRRPVVATAIAGIRELVDDGKSGVLVSPGRTDELARALERLLRNPDLCQQLGEAGRRHVARCYDIGSSAGQLQELFGDLRCEQSPAPANADRPTDQPSPVPDTELARQTTPQSSTAPSLTAR
jgi:colanic acid/amylovoran biosynthesis glycosyltransferase